MASWEKPIGKITAARQKNITGQYPIDREQRNLIPTCHKSDPLGIGRDGPVPDTGQDQYNGRGHADAAAEHADLHK